MIKKKKLNKLEIEEKFLNLINDFYGKLTAIITLKVERLNAFFVISGSSQGCSLLLLPLLFNTVVYVLAGAIRQEKGI